MTAPRRAKVKTEAFLLNLAPDNRSATVEVYFDATTPYKSVRYAAWKVIRTLPGLQGRWKREEVSRAQIDPGTPEVGIGMHAIYQYTRTN